MRAIGTFEDLVHAVTNSLTLISSRAQYLLDRHRSRSLEDEELETIRDEAERAASLLGLIGDCLGRGLAFDFRSGHGLLATTTCRGDGGDEQEPS